MLTVALRGEAWVACGEHAAYLVLPRTTRPMPLGGAVVSDGRTTTSRMRCASAAIHGSPESTSQSLGRWAPTLECAPAFSVTTCIAIPRWGFYDSFLPVQLASIARFASARGRCDVIPVERSLAREFEPSEQTDPQLSQGGGPGRRAAAATG